MNAGRFAATLTVAVVLLTALLSGPLVGAVDLTKEPPVDTDFNPGQGSANVTVLSVPETGTLKQFEFGAGAYYLRMDAMEVNVTAVEGQPLLVYKLRSSDLTFVSSTNTFLNESSTGPMTVPFREDTIQRERVNASRDSYTMELVVGVLANDTERVIQRSNVTVEVER